MSKFDEIRSAVSTLVTDSDAYWKKLQAVYVLFNGQLMQYWGVTHGVVLDNSGTQHGVFKTGVYDNVKKEITPQAPFSLPRDGYKLCFDLLMNLPDAGSDVIAYRKVTRIKYEFSNGEYIFEVEGIPTNPVCTEKNGVVDLTPLFDALHSQLLNHLKFRR
ncbi:hypothetical protein [Enterobacter roggenkampii]|uniref:hypothetical protein n=1 Tax=Enterobacter roggenkampii TaxID=1812935 RepID=UPI0035D3FDF0